MYDDIGVDEHQDVSARHRGATIARPCRAPRPVRRLDQRRAVTARNGRRVVCRAVIHHDHLGAARRGGESREDIRLSTSRPSRTGMITDSFTRDSPSGVHCRPHRVGGHREGEATLCGRRPSQFSEGSRAAACVARLLRALRDAARLHRAALRSGDVDDFFDDLGFLPPPDIDLAVGSASHAEQTAEVMRRFEAALRAEQPHAVVVVGDLNSTLACALASAKFFRAEPFTFAGRMRRRPVTIQCGGRAAQLR